jgi:hypothetical protein
MFLSSSTERENMAHPRSATDFLLLGYKHFPPNRAKTESTFTTLWDWRELVSFRRSEDGFTVPLSGAAACLPKALKKHTAPPERNYLFFSYKHFAPNGAKTVTRAVGEILVSLCRSETLKKHTTPPERNYLFSLAINISLLTERRRLPEVGEILVSLLTSSARSVGARCL